MSAIPISHEPFTLVDSLDQEYLITPSYIGYFGQTYENLALGGGAVDVNIGVWSTLHVAVITTTVVRYVGTAPATLAVAIYDGTTAFVYGALGVLATGDYISIPGETILPPNSQVQIQIRNATAGNDIYLWVSGYWLKSQG